MTISKSNDCSTPPRVRRSSIVAIGMGLLLGLLPVLAWSGVSLSINLNHQGHIGYSLGIHSGYHRGIHLGYHHSYRPRAHHYIMPRRHYRPTYPSAHYPSKYHRSHRPTYQRAPSHHYARPGSAHKRPKPVHAYPHSKRYSRPNY